MQTFKYYFVVLQCIGLWRPAHWPPGWKTVLYDCHTVFMVFLFITVTLSELIELLRSMDDPEKIANNSFILLTMMGTCGKAINILNKRDDIINLENILNRDPCRPKTNEEYAIKRKFDRRFRSNTSFYAACVGISVLIQVIKSVVEDIPRRTLPYRSWLPFDYYESLFDYSIVYVHQIVTHVTGAAVHVIFDALVCGLMLQTCAQLNILKHSFNEMSKLLHDVHCELDAKDESNLSILYLESKLIAQRVSHHIEILKFANKSNNLFGVAMLLQFAISTLVLCVSVYQLLMTEPYTVQYASHMLYLGCMLTQIFIPCFYGSEVTFESLKLCDAIYAMDWTTLSLCTKRSLLMVMARSLKPIEFMSVAVITVNLDSFNSLVKLSYSAYNIMQQVTE